MVFSHEPETVCHFNPIIPQERLSGVSNLGPMMPRQRGVGIEWKSGSALMAALKAPEGTRYRIVAGVLGELRSRFEQLQQECKQPQEQQTQQERHKLRPTASPGKKPAEASGIEQHINAVHTAKGGSAALPLMW